MFHSIDLRGEGWSTRLYLPKDNRYSIPSSHPNFAGVRSPEHALEGDLGSQELGKQAKKGGERSRCQAQRMTASWGSFGYGL